MVIKLLEWKADPNIKDNFLQTPLHHAVNNGNLNMVAKLIEWKADPNI